MSFIIHDFVKKGFPGFLRDIFQFEPAGTKVFWVKNQGVGFSKKQSKNNKKINSTFALIPGVGDHSRCWEVGCQQGEWIHQYP